MARCINHGAAVQCGYAGDSWRLVEPLLLAQCPAQADRRRALYGFLRGAATTLAADASAAAAQHGQAAAPATPTAEAALAPDAGRALTAAGRSALPTLMQQYALLAVAGAAAVGAGSAAAGTSSARQAAGGKQAGAQQQPAELDAYDPGLQPVLQLLRLDSTLLPPFLAALCNLHSSTPADGAVAAATGLPPAVQALPAAAGTVAAAAGAAASVAGSSHDEATLQAATGAMSVLAAVLADSEIRSAVLEAECLVQRLIDAVAEVCAPVCFSVPCSLSLIVFGCTWRALCLGLCACGSAACWSQVHHPAPGGTPNHCTSCRRRWGRAPARWLGINTSS